ncbi:chaperone NapD [Luteimonas sp. A478]
MSERDELHIASLLIHHQVEASDAIRQLVDTSDGLEIALADHNRSVLLQESADTRGLMDNVDRLRDLPGVVSVNLVYHHVESRAELEQPHVQLSPAIRSRP